MGIFDIIKKAFVSEKTEVAFEPETIEFHALADWLANKEKDHKEKEKRVFDMIKERTNLSTSELNSKLELLRAYDLEGKKAEDKYKAIVKEASENYISNVEEFIKNLNLLDEKDLGSMIESTNNIFKNFENRSYMSYEKATILIGKEMEAVKEATKALSKYFKQIFDENKNLVDTGKSLNYVSSVLKEIDEIDKEFININEKIVLLDEKLGQYEGTNNKILGDIAKISASEEHNENRKIRKEMDKLLEEIDEEINGLRGKINFKALANFFHELVEKMEKVKAHKENFYESFQKDNGSTIISLIDTSKTNNEVIIEKIKSIHDKKDKHRTLKDSVKEDQTRPLTFMIDELNVEIRGLEEEKYKHKRVHEKMASKKKEKKDLIKNKLKEIGVGVKV